MANRIDIKVVVDDNGSIKLTEKSAKKLDKAMQQTGKSVQQTDRFWKGASQQSANSTKNYSKLAQTIQGGLVPAYATLAAQIFAVSAAFRFLRDAGALKQLQQGQMAYAAAIGTSMRTLAQDIKQATDAQISYQEASRAAAIGVAAGLTPDQLRSLGKAAKDVSPILGRDLTDSFNRLIRGVTKAEPELLDELGIILRLRDATEEYKRANKITGELTTFQKTQAVTADVLGQVEEKYSKLLEIQAISANSFERLAASFDKIIDGLKRILGDGLAPLAELLAEYPGIIAAAFAPFTAKVFAAGLPGLENMKSTLEGLGRTATETAARATEEVKEMNSKILEFSGDEKLQAKRRKVTQQQLKEIAAVTKTNRINLIQRAADGEALTNKQIAGIRRQLAVTENAYGITNKKIKANLAATLTEMEALNRAATTRMAADYAKLPSALSVQMTKAQAIVAGGFAKMAAFGVRAGAVIAAAFSVISWVTLIASLGAVVWSFLRSKDAAEDAAEAIDYFGDRVKNVTEESAQFIAVQNGLYSSFELGNKVLTNFGDKLANISTKSVLKNLGNEYTEVADIIFEESNKIREQLDFTKKSLEEAQDMSTLERGMLSSTIGMGYGMNTDPELMLTEKKLELEEKLKTQTLENFLASDQADKVLEKNQRDALALLLDERSIALQINNERFGQNKAVQAYVAILEDLNKTGKIDKKQLEARRNEVMKIATLFKQISQLQADNTKKFDEFSQSYLAVSKEDALITSLKQERDALLQSKETNVDLIEQEKERLEIIDKQLGILRTVANEQYNSQLETLKLATKEERVLRGKSKLIAKDLKTEFAIARNLQKQTDLRQRIQTITDLNEDKRNEILELSKSTNKVDQDRLKTLQEDLNARERDINLNEERLNLLKEQEKSLERQLNNIKKIADAAKQSFEDALVTGFDNLITNVEGSLTDSILTGAETVLKSISKVISEEMSKATLNFLGLGKTKQDPAEKMKTALEEGTTKIVKAMSEGADIIYRRIRQALGLNPALPGKAQGTKMAPGPTSKEVLATLKDPMFIQQEVAKEELEGVHGLTKEKALENAKEGTAHQAKLFDSRLVQENKFLDGLGKIFKGFGDTISELFSENGFLGGLRRIFGGLYQNLKTVLFSFFSGGSSGGGGSNGWMGLVLESVVGGFIGGAGGGAASSAGTNATSSGVLAALNDPMFAANGMVMRGGFRAFADGSAKVTEPTLGVVGEGRYNEAVVPLPDGDSIPVQMMGAGGNTNNTTVNVTIGDGQVQETNVQSQAQQGAQLGKLISLAVQKELQNQTRPGGILSPIGGNG